MDVRVKGSFNAQWTKGILSHFFVDLCSRYLWLEKDGHPEWSRLSDGSDSDERHIFHKALYDATSEAIRLVYKDANRIQVSSRDVRKDSPRQAHTHKQATIATKTSNTQSKHTLKSKQR